MRRSIKFVVVLLHAIIVLGSCSKHTVTPNFMMVPWNMDSLMTGSAAYLIGQSQLNVSGILIHNTLTGNLKDTFGNTYSYVRNWEAALFMWESNTSTGGVSAVTMNSVSLDTANLYCFTRYDATAIWNESTVNTWNVAGSDKIPSFSTDIAGTMPVFTGSLPSSIDTSSDFSFTFNSMNVTNGDSALVIIYGSGYGANQAHSSVVSCNGGNAIISHARLKDFQNSYGTIYPGDTSIYFGGQIMFVIYNHVTMTFGGKQFAFVKQREYIGIVSFL